MTKILCRLWQLGGGNQYETMLSNTIELVERKSAFKIKITPGCGKYLKRYQIDNVLVRIA